MHYVSVENLGKSYGIKPLFEGIGFHIEEGDKIALIARNGSGKSTLQLVVFIYPSLPVVAFTSNWAASKIPISSSNYLKQNKPADYF